MFASGATAHRAIAYIVLPQPRAVKVSSFWCNKKIKGLSFFGLQCICMPKPIAKTVCPHLSLQGVSVKRPTNVSLLPKCFVHMSGD